MQLQCPWKCREFLTYNDLKCLLSPAAPKVISRGAEGPGREILQRPPSVRLSVCPSVRPSVRPSVCLSVTFSFHTSSKTHWCIFSKLCRYVHHVMGVCCIVFFLYWWNVFEFCMNFLNIEKNKINICFQYLKFSSRFMLFTRRRRPGTGDIATPPVRPSVCLSVHHI